MDTSKQANQYVKGHIQNIWERNDATGEPVVPYKKIGEQFKIVQTINLEAPRPGQAITIEGLTGLIANPNIDVSMVEAPKPKQ